MKKSSQEDGTPDRHAGTFQADCFAAWVTHSPRNVRTFLIETAVTLELQGLDAEHLLDLEAVVERAKADLASGNFEDPIG
jgi:hypothetical protein